MGDQSWVSLHVHPDPGLDGYTIQAIARICGAVAELTKPTYRGGEWEEEDIDLETISLAGEQTSGSMCFGYWDVNPLDKLEALQIGYDVYDGGHYTWDPDHTAWRPGMTARKTRSCGTEGTPYLHEGNLRTLENLCVAMEDDPNGWGRDDMLEAIRGHLSDDPTRWL